jgi:hypothetical protein
VPLSPAWASRFATPRDVAEWLGIARGPVSALLRRHWQRVAPSETSGGGWLLWNPCLPRDERRDFRPGYKLYVSPACASVAEALRATVDVLAHAGAPPFKIGEDARGLLRPDKLVVYFANVEELERAADRLRHELAGMPAQGVPFTAPVTSDGLLSWGMDPPQADSPLPWQRRESWRLWVANRLAAFLLAAKHAAVHDGETAVVEPWRFALERLRLAGVDTATWAPQSTLWRDDLVTGG